MNLWLGFLTIGGLALLAAISPGPDCVVVMKNTILSSRRAGMFTSLGVGLGILVHVAYSIVGIGLIVSKSIFLFNIFKLLGAAYLGYIGWRLVRSKAESAIPALHQRETQISPLSALKNGFFTNALNPKATLFFVSVFTQVVSPETPLIVQLFYGIEIAAIVCLWFVALACILSTPKIKVAFARVQHRISQTMGAVLMALGIKMALAQMK